MRGARIWITSSLAIVLVLAVAGQGGASGLSFNLTGPYSENFDTLAVTGTSSTTPAGWEFVETGTNADTTYTAGTGSSNTGDAYSFGAAGVTERAFGGLQSGSLVPTIGASFANGTGATITALDVAYTGEQWRLGTAGRTDRIDFQYSLDATSLTTGTWIDVNALDFSSPTTTGTPGMLDGNLAANRTALASTITGLSIAPSSTFWIRWASFDATGADDGLAADDFALTPLFSSCGTPTPIVQIQGAAHRSPLLSTTVCGTFGIVTARLGNGFFMQDPSGDGNPGTSDGIFVFTSTPPSPQVGDSVTVSGTVAEFRPGGASSANLATTELTAPTVVINSTGNPLPAPVTIGPPSIPTTVIDDDTGGGDAELSGSFDTTDGLDFYETFEGMRLRLNSPVVVGPTNAFGEVVVLPADGSGASVRTTRGGIVIRPNDFNPERIILDDTIIGAGAMPSFDVGDHVLSGAVEGVLDYSFGNFKLLVDSAPAPLDGGLGPEVTALPTAAQVAIATLNVENLDPGDGVAKFDALAAQIVNNLRSPDVVALEEVQDNTGPTNDTVVAADVTLDTLVASITAAGGPAYDWRQINPVDDQDGGEPGGNIRVAFLFRTDRGLAFVDKHGGGPTVANSVVGGELLHSPGRIDPTNPAFNLSRKPLAAEFIFAGVKLFLIANHWNSKGGDQPLFGRFQPPALNSEAQRLQQAQVVRGFVDQLLSANPTARVIVLGDLNDFEFSPPLQTLEGTDLTTLIETLPQQERYTYVFDGNSQALDHTVVSPHVAGRSPAYDVVHVNSEFASQVSDHDPQVMRFDPTAAPTAVRTASIRATRAGRAAIVRWRTGTEVGVLGFQVYRERAGRRVRVGRLVAAAGTARGRAYAVRDRRSAAGTRYWVRELRADGGRRWHGPVRVR